MFCKNCGTVVDERSGICPKCGTANKVSYNNDSSAEKKANIIRLSKFILPVLIIISAICDMQYVVTGFRNWKEYNWDESLSIPPVIIVMLPAIVFLAVSVMGVIITISCISYVRSKKSADYYCPKCKKQTHHNKFDVCEECYLDLTANTTYPLFFFIVGLVLSIVFIIFLIMIIGEKADNVLSWLAIFHVVIGGLALFNPIYMYPAKIARRTAHTTANAIFWLNVFFGLTLVMWIVLLIWASSGKGNQQAVVIQQSAPVQPKKTTDSFDELKKLKDMGMITEEEFEVKRQELLKRI